MSFFAILLALLIEQAQPLGRGNPVHVGMRAWMRWVVRSFDAGHPHHGWLAWSLAVGLPSVAAVAIHWVLMALLGWPAAVLWSVAVLYATLGFRQFSHRFTGIRDALDANDLYRARRLLAAWHPVDEHEMTRGEIIRAVIEHSVIAAHRHVFGVLSWYVVFASIGLGPAGAVFYRLSEFVVRYWRHVPLQRGLAVSDSACAAAGRAWHVVDWLAARITALGFAVVGSFQDAIDCWKTRAQGGALDNDAVILAATAGAVNVNIGAAQADATDATAAVERPAPEMAHLQIIVGLVWRSVVMWVGLLGLLMLVRLLG